MTAATGVVPAWRRTINHMDILSIVTGMREWDRREVYACRWDDDPLTLAHQLAMSGDFGWVIGQERPIAGVGAVPLWPGVWSAWMIATDEWPAVALPVTRFVRRAMIPALLRDGAHRVECDSMVGHDVAHAWLRVLGAVQEGPPRHRGRNREPFITFIWTREGVLGRWPGLRAELAEPMPCA